MNPANVWFVMIAGGLGTFLCRYSFFWLSGKKDLPEKWVSILRYVPPAVLAALIVPGIVIPGIEAGYPVWNPRVLAALVATLVAWRTRGVTLTFILGMLSLWLFQYLMP